MNETGSKRRLLILHLEDNPRDRELVRTHLDNQGFPLELVVVRTREEFEYALERSSFDLILSDFSLPSYDGLSALNIARAKQPETPFIFVSGTIGEERAVESMKVGATDYVLKSNLHRLGFVVERALREAKDRTERRRAEIALRQSEARFSGIFSASPVAICISTIHEGRLIEINPQFCEFFGYSHEEMIGHTVFELNLWANPDDRAPIMQRLSHERALRGIEVKQRRRSGELRDVLASLELIELPGENEPLLISILTDITERKQAEAQIRAQALFLDLAPNAIVVRDLENRVLYWNRGAVELYGWLPQEAIGEDLTTLIYRNPDALAVAVAAVLKNGEWIGELEQANRTGKQLVVGSRWTLVRDEHGVGRSILAIDTDITEKKLLEAQLLRTQRMESIGSIAGGVAHDLNNVLAPILMTAEFLLQQQGHDGETRKLLATIQTCAQRGAEVVGQVLMFARGGPVKQVMLDPRQLIRDLVRMVEPTFPKSIVITANTEKEVWSILGDSTQLHQVLLNLCVNARDAMPSGGKLTITAENLVVDEHFVGMAGEVSPGAYTILKISDTGAGIPQEIIQRIFEPFFTTKTFGKGTGLGLSTVVGIVRSHGGFLDVKSKLGEGSTFSVYLPAKPVHCPPEREVPTKALSQGMGEQILVVDDEAAIRNLLKMVLEANGYTVLIAKDGIEALALYALNHWNVRAVLTDIMMPNLDGVSLIRVLKQINPAIKIAVSTGNADILADAVNSEALGKLNIEQVLTKPYSSHRILDTIHALIEGN